MSLLYLLIFLKAGAHLVIHVVHYRFDRTPIGFRIEHMKIYTKQLVTLPGFGLCVAAVIEIYIIQTNVYAVTPIPAV